MSKRVRKQCDVLVVGAGPAGIAATVAAAKAGARVILADDNPMPGGQIWRFIDAKPGTAPKSDPVRWLDDLSASGAEQLYSTRIVALLFEKCMLAESDSNALEISFEKIILATGARERMLPFPGWTLPHVFAPGGLQALVKSGLDVRGKRIVIAGTGPLLLAVAALLKAKGANVAGIFDQASTIDVARFALSLMSRPKLLFSAAAYRLSVAGTPMRWGWWPVSAAGNTTLQSVSMTNGKRLETIECDMLACGFHLVPNTELQAAMGCTLLDGKTVVNDEQETTQRGVYSVGESTGIGGLDLALVEGQIAGLAATTPTAEMNKLKSKRVALTKSAHAMNAAFALRPQLRALVTSDTIVCRCEDVRWSALQHQPSMRAARLHHRCGMGACQGRICGAALQFLTGWPATATRPPIFPVRMSTLIDDQRDSESNSNSSMPAKP